MDLLSIPEEEVILIVDDEESMRSVMTQALMATNRRILPARDVEEAEAFLRTEVVHLVITDINMPGRSGISLLKASRERGEVIPFIIITGFTSTDLAVQACNLGVYSFLSKPFHLKNLCQAVDAAMALQRITWREKQDRLLLQESNDRLRQEVLAALMENQRLLLEMIQSLAAAIDARDSYTHLHSKAVAELAARTAKTMGLPSEEQNIIREAGLVHDIGKIGVPELILNKPCALDEAEYSIMKKHPVIGANILAPVLSLEAITPLVRYHHERFDGSGYPDRLNGDEIPLGARILAVCDTWNAITTDRPYRKALSIETAIDIIDHERGKQFDKVVCEALLSMDHLVPEEQ